MAQYFWIGCGGALGAILRCFVQTKFTAAFGSFPYGTMLVNLLGSFLIGFLVPLLPENHAIRYVLIGGFLGALTTMSTFALETHGLLTAGKVLSGLGYWFSGAVVCVALCGLGLFLGRQVSA